MSNADWSTLTTRAGVAGHDVVGWLMWDPRAIAEYAALGIPNGMGWVVAWRMATLGDVPPAVAAAAAYSINPAIVTMVLDSFRNVTTAQAVLEVRDNAIEPGLAEIAPGLGDQLAELTEPLWRGVDSAHFGARSMFAASSALPRPEGNGCLSAWLAANCLRELRGDNHWALCAAADLDAVEVGLLHSAMVDPEEYETEEWIARSRGNDDAAVAAGWARLEAKGYATNAKLNATGKQFRLDLESRTNELTMPAWQAVGESATIAFCEAIEPHHDAFVTRINETAGPKWMPAVRVKSH